MGFETPEEGYLAKIIVAAGSKNVPIGKLVCIIVNDEASVAAFKNFQDDSPAPAAAAAAPPPPAAAAPPPPAAAAPAAPKPAATAAPSIPSMSTGDRIFASPFARRLASEQGLSLDVRNSLNTIIIYQSDNLVIYLFRN